jgi:hypothetical protein
VLGAAAAALGLAVAHPVSDRFSTSAALVCLIAAALGLVVRPSGSRSAATGDRIPTTSAA